MGLRVCAVGDAVGEEVPRPPHGRAPTALCLRPLNAIGRHEMCHGWRAAVESEDGALRGRKRRGRVVYCLAYAAFAQFYHGLRLRRTQSGSSGFWLGCCEVVSPEGLVLPSCV